MNMFTEAEWNNAGNPGRFLDFVGTYDRDILEKYRTGADLDLYPNSDWMELLSEHTTNQRYTINFRGGSEKPNSLLQELTIKKMGFLILILPKGIMPIQGYNVLICVPM